MYEYNAVLQKQMLFLCNAIILVSCPVVNQRFQERQCTVYKLVVGVIISVLIHPVQDFPQAGRFFPPQSLTRNEYHVCIKQRDDLLDAHIAHAILTGPGTDTIHRGQGLGDACIGPVSCRAGMKVIKNAVTMSCGVPDLFGSQKKIIIVGHGGIIKSACTELIKRNQPRT